MRYVDGYLLVVSKKNLAKYRRIAKKAGDVWRKCGALEYMECVGDDLSPEFAALKFPQLMKVKPGEAVIFSFVIFKSRAHRDRVNAKVMKDPYMSPENMEKHGKDMPFDMKRIAYGGFKGIVDV